jgi:hypothetical protein
MLVTDHFLINVAQCVRMVGKRREYQHKFRIELPSGRTRKEALETYDEIKGIYPAPNFEVRLTSVVCRGITIADNLAEYPEPAPA